jgi:prepilin-type N-terminal cleavage/methylation domain-containing protein
MRKIICNKSGFTLIELMIAVLISGVIITAVYQIMTTSSRANTQANAQLEAANSLDSTFEVIRQLTMNATEMKICDSSSYSAASGQDTVRYEDDVIYMDDKVIGSAAQYGAGRIELEFESNEANLLKVSINSYDIDGNLLEDKSRTMDLYLQSLTDSIEVESEGMRNCITFKVAN